MTGRRNKEEHRELGLDELSDAELEDVSGGNPGAVAAGVGQAIMLTAAVYYLGKEVYNAATGSDSDSDSVPIITDKVRNAGKNARPQ